MSFSVRNVKYVCRNLYSMSLCCWYSINSCLTPCILEIGPSGPPCRLRIQMTTTINHAQDNLGTISHHWVDNHVVATEYTSISNSQCKYKHQAIILIVLGLARLMLKFLPSLDGVSAPGGLSRDATTYAVRIQDGIANAYSAIESLIGQLTNLVPS